jgi:uncharacterized membrane protein YraQ (UPF0718 family)
MANFKKYYLVFILAGYSIWFFFLLSTGALKHYINPRLSFLAFLTLFIFIAMLLNLFRKSGHHCTEQAQHCECGHYHQKWEKTSLILLLPLILSILFPAQTLSYQDNTLEITTLLPRLATVLLSIVIQALPFVLIGVFSSAAMHHLVTAEMIETKLSQTTKLTGILLAIGAGFFFPVCDCGVIPVARRLLIKKVPPYMAIAFLVTAPLINPITIWATATAFGYNLPITLSRVIIAIIVGIIVAFAVSRFFPTIEQLFNQKTLHELEIAAAVALPGISDHVHQKSTAADIFNHANEEFLEVGKFLIIGSLIAATIQTAIFKPLMMTVAQNAAFSVIMMMLLAVCLSLCAEADAFVARSFLAHFPIGSILSFMVYGQMIDLKNLALLLKNFKPQALVVIFGLCALLVFGLGSLINLTPIGTLIMRR